MNAMSSQKTSSGKRTYELKQRAKSQEETRRRIVEATAALHEEVGPAQTTVAEIARRAGVQRLTVYKHFPEDAELFEACSGHYLSQHPMPDLSPALAIEDPGKRLGAVLKLIYDRYRQTQSMTEKVLRDRLLLPALDQRVALTVDEPMRQLGEALTAGFKARGRRKERIAAVVAVALDFWTWRRLNQQGLDDEAAAALMADAISCVADG